RKSLCLIAHLYFGALNELARSFMCSFRSITCIFLVQEFYLYVGSSCVRYITCFCKSSLMCVMSCCASAKTCFVSKLCVLFANISRVASALLIEAKQLFTSEPTVILLNSFFTLSI